MSHASHPAGRLGRKTHLATALGLALTLGLSGALAAQPSLTDAGHMRLNQSVVSSQDMAWLTRPNLATAHGAAHATNTPAATFTVTNCNDSGSGSLREAVDLAPTGSLIDLSGLSCNVIKLNSSIVTSVDDLTLKGKITQKYDGTLVPGMMLDGQNTVEPLAHYGSGTLTLQQMSVQNGKHSISGGCIFSAGDVKLVDSTAKYCNVERTSTSSSRGGAIDASGNVILDNSLVHGNKAINNGSGGAVGGGVYSGGQTSLLNGAVISSNTADARGSGDAKGGGAYAKNGLMSPAGFGGGGIFDGNKALATSGKANGGGAFALSESIIANTEVTSNEAKNGAGIYFEGSSTVKYSTFNDNTATRLGGGLYAEGDMTVQGTTIAGNHAGTDGGGIFAHGNANIVKTTIANNTSPHVAGADLGENATQVIYIEQSTISGNEATASKWGSGLYLRHDAVIKNSTITGNVEANTTDTKYGGGIALKSGVNVDLSSTIVAGNLIRYQDDSTNPSDIGMSMSSTGGTLSGDHNLLGYTATLTMPAGSLTTFEPKLGPLRDNGGFTWTHVPLAASQAIDNGAANGFSTDQRGGNFKRVSGAQADIGAVERISDRIFADNFEG